MSHNAGAGGPANNFPGGMKESIILPGRADSDANATWGSPGMQRTYADTVFTKAIGEARCVLTYIAIQKICPGWEHMKAQFRKTNAQDLSLFCIVGECLQNMILIGRGGERGGLGNGGNRKCIAHARAVSHEFSRPDPVADPQAGEPVDF